MWLRIEQRLGFSPSDAMPLARSIEMLVDKWILCQLCCPEAADSRSKKTNVCGITANVRRHATTLALVSQAALRRRPYSSPTSVLPEQATSASHDSTP